MQERSQGQLRLHGKGTDNPGEGSECILLIKTDYLSWKVNVAGRRMRFNDQPVKNRRVGILAGTDFYGRRDFGWVIVPSARPASIVLADERLEADFARSPGLFGLSRGMCRGNQLCRMSRLN